MLSFLNLAATAVSVPPTKALLQKGLSVASLPRAPVPEHRYLREARQVRVCASIAIVTVLATVACAKSNPNSTNKADHVRGSPESISSVGDVIYRSKNGNVLTRADLAQATGEVNWEILSPAPISAEARDLHQRGREAGARGDHEGALTLLERSERLAPQWPYAIYDAAFTCLLKGDPDNALRLYRRTVALAPRGFFTAITAAHYLALESEGNLPKGTYLAYVLLEWIDSPAERVKRVDAIATSTPNFAPIWKEKAALTEAAAERVALLDRGLKLDPDRETRGFLLIDRALALSALERKGEAVAILGELGADQSQPLDVQQISLATLANIMSK